MCRLLGIYGQTDIWREIAVAFSQQAESGHIPPEETQKPGHKDGWGIAMTNRGKTAMTPVIRQLGAAHEASSYREAIYAMSATPAILLCHLRKASDIIPITLANVHPFIHNGWAIIHNGTVFHAESLPRDPGFKATSDGSDTEHFFHYLLTKLENPPPGQTMARTLANAVASINTDYSAVNCIVSNGRELYAIRQYRKWEDYYTLYTYSLPGSLIISSQPVELPQLKADNWRLLPNSLLLRIYDTPLKIDRLDITQISDQQQSRGYDEGPSKGLGPRSAGGR
jgi:predicted glutamine amidotransferase